MKLGVNSVDDLAKLRVSSIDDLSKIGIKNADDLAKLGIDSSDLKKLGIDPKVFEGVSNPAHNAAQYDKLKTYYQQAEKYGTGSINELPDGRFRFYEEIKQARTQGEMAGVRHVREWNPQTGAKRDWYEALDHLGNIRQVRPSPDITGGLQLPVYFPFASNI